MKLIEFSNMCKCDFNIYKIISKRQSWTDGEVFCGMNSARSYNGFLFLQSCSARIEHEDGTTETAGIGDILYIPKNFKYNVTFFDCKAGCINSYITNFLMSNADGEEIIFSDKIEKTAVNNPYEISKLMEEIASESEMIESSPVRMKSALYSICLIIGNTLRQRAHSNDYYIISKGVEYLHEHIDDNLKINDIAKMCSVSTACFRKIFKKYNGCSPKEYILGKKTEKAKELFKSGLYNVNEVSSILGFADTSYFSELFKKKTGRTPTQYINRE